MKAAQINTYGGPEVITVTQVDQPIPTDGQVLVEVYASSLNPFDTAIRAGNMKKLIPLHLPATLGGDIAVVVSQLGPNVTSFTPGGKVYGQASVVAGNSGAFAEHAATAASQLGRMPSNLDFEQAASLPLVGVSALQALTEHINIAPAQKLFIHGGAGGIGSLAIQIAKHLGAYVATTATGDNIEHVKHLGADQVIDYKALDFSTAISGFDGVFDTVGGSDFIKSFNILRSGGIAVSMIAQADESKAKELGITAITQATKVNTEKLTRLGQLVEQGVIKPQVTKSFPLDEVVAAFQERESGLSRGKIVLKIR